MIDFRWLLDAALMGVCFCCAFARAAWTLKALYSH